MRMLVLVFGVAVLVASGSAQAGFLIRIGDIDGFGYGTAPGFQAAGPGLANVDGSGVLGDGDFLPDINNNGILATGQGDDFDLRGVGELSDTAVSAAAGVSNTTGTVGSKFTDISLSTSYGVSQAANNVLIGGNPTTGLLKGAGGAFPDGTPAVRPNQPGFKFRFDVLKGAITAGQQIFFNLIFGDYDVVPASIKIILNDGTDKIINLVRQGSNQDGLIQAATATLDFDDVFSNGGAVWTGKLDVDFQAPNEPYTAFDYVELSTVPLVSPVPVPPSLALVGLGGVTASLGGLLRRRRVGTSAR